MIARLIDNFCANRYTKIMSQHSTFGFKGDFRFVAERLAIGRGGRVLAADLNFALHAGEALVVTGPNGAGKSTLLRMLAGLLAPLAGRIAISGAGIEPDAQAGFCAHYLGHADALKSALTVSENLQFWAAMLGAPGERVEIALATVGLSHVADVPAGYLSAGQKRRVALARLLVAHRPLWLLDEPATGLDAASQKKLADMMGAYRQQGGVVIAATHAPLGLDGAQELRLAAAMASNDGAPE